ncbi:hypothetical protein DN752_02400 [Echinicola strongylocentroti]|uniref:Tail specific protease domain-containing protein n=1 Tax=Echinicola strongylocentroti TaxID=1795355 RepID=A0A2Z4IE08_9BACT|nr:S41 family peptidase [Echinicola strongylocentroti]AWW29080.1 hypothetical protein DN752_02400 [Echinicola strongylocentroti]
MKSLFLAIIFTVFAVFFTHARELTSLSESHKFKQFGLVWGLMKYHHPLVSKGKYNWSEAFVKNVEKLERIKTQEALNLFLLNFINSIKPSKIKISNDFDGLFTKNYDYDWISKFPATSELYKKLNALKLNTNISDYYVSIGTLSIIPTFENEKGLEKFDVSIKSHRLLTLFSFWNAIQYFDVNKYLMDTDWEDTLDTLIPKFLICESELKYERLKAELVRALDDSHALYLNQKLLDSLFKYKPSFATNLVNDTLVVVATFDQNAEDYNKIKLGDKIVKIEGKSINRTILENLSPYISASNYSYLKRFSNWILRGQSDSLKITIARNDSLFSKCLPRYKDLPNTNQKVLSRDAPKKKWQFIEDDIGYINLRSISKQEIKTAFSSFTQTKGIIIDLRKTPSNLLLNELTRYLYPKRKKFIRVLGPISNRPSLAKHVKSPLRLISDPFKTGHKNRNFYRNKVILLVNNNTMSQSEYIGMAIQGSPNCLTVGKTTAGAVMNIAAFTLPDATQVNFTSLGAFYPDDTSAQRKGLKIDHYVNETTSNFLRDQYVLKGIELIKMK